MQKYYVDVSYLEDSLPKEVSTIVNVENEAEITTEFLAEHLDIPADTITGFDASGE